MAFDLDELTEHDGTGDCPICRAQVAVDGAYFSLALHGAAGRDHVEPALDVGEIVDVLALPIVQPAPRKDRHVGDGILVGRHVLPDATSTSSPSAQVNEIHVYVR